MSQYQDRMPLILEADEIDTWLYGTTEEARALIFACNPDLVAETVNGQQSLF